MIIALAVLASLASNPLVELPSPKILYDDSGGKEWIAANKALGRLKLLSRSAQIAYELEYAKACVPKGKAVPRYEWRPDFDFGKFDLILMAKGRRPLMLDASQLSFVKGGKGTVWRTPGSTPLPHEYKPALALRDARHLRLALRCIRRGDFVIQSKVKH